RGIALNPDLSEGYNNLGMALIVGARLEEGVEALRRGVARAPQNAALRSTLLIALNYRSRPPGEMLREHREFARHHPPAPGSRAAATSPDPERRLRIGYLSADLRNHSVG